MNLIQQMNAAEFKQLLDFKATYPTLGEDLVKVLSTKTLAIQLTLGECIDLSNATGIRIAESCNQIFDTFKSKP